jgi:pimeloyl-ACP methyl ester carboxylesterase
MSVPAPEGGSIHVGGQPRAGALCDVLYVHGATFPSDLSVFYRLDDRSWADALNEAGFSAWGLDFVGYGRSSRYPTQAPGPLGRADQALLQLTAAIEHLRTHNGGRRVALIAHSWGTIVAARAAIAAPEAISALVMFGPILCRRSSETAEALPPLRLITVWEQYRAFIAEVPADHPPVMSDRHFDAWSRAYLASDPQACGRQPAAVLTPTGPQADILDVWRGALPFSPAAIGQPILVIRGEWDSLCPDDGVAELLGAVSSQIKVDVKIPKGTHRMHLEERRHELHGAVNEFLHRVLG